MREIVIIPLDIIKSFECAGHFQFSLSKVDGLSNFGAADLRDERGAKLPRHDGMSERVSFEILGERHGEGLGLFPRL
jgi:hypothetical protein